MENNKIVWYCNTNYNNKEEHSIIKISYWNAIGVFITNESHTDNSMRPRFVTKIVYQNCFTKNII